MRRLAVFKWLEAEIRGRMPDRRQMRMSVSVGPRTEEDVAFERVNVKRIVDYRLRIGARVVADDHGPGIQHARERVCELLAREMFDDITQELIDLQEFAFEQGLGQDVEARIGRLIALTRGQEVEDVPKT